MVYFNNLEVFLSRSKKPAILEISGTLLTTDPTNKMLGILRILQIEVRPISKKCHFLIFVNPFLQRS